MKKNSLIFFNLYFLFSVVYYCLGYYKWNIPSYFKLLSFLLICYLSLNVGYHLSWIGHGKLRRGLYRDYNFVLPGYGTEIRKLFLISAFSLIIFQIAWVLTFFGQFNIRNILSVLGENYFSRLEKTFDSKVPIMQLRTLMWGITLFVYPIGFIYTKQMPRKDKVIFGTALFVDAFASLNMGVSKNIGDIVISYISVVILKSVVNTAASPYARRMSKQSKKRIVLAALVFFLIFFVIQNMRNSVLTTVKPNPYGFFAEINEKNLFRILFGKNIESLFSKIGGYVSNAYTGLAYALELPFKNTYGLGFSRALMEYADQYLKLSLKSLTYNARIEALYGWHDGMWWPTAFVWIANAVSFVFVPAVMLLLGAFFRHLEDEYARTGNVVVAAMYIQMVITLVYLPCNMQIFQSRASLIGSLSLLVCFFTRRKLFKRLGRK